jgi:hypothetical protein
VRGGLGGLPGRAWSLSSKAGAGSLQVPANFRTTGTSRKFVTSLPAGLRLTTSAGFSRRGRDVGAGGAEALE